MTAAQKQPASEVVSSPPLTRATRCARASHLAPRTAFLGGGWVTKTSLSEAARSTAGWHRGQPRRVGVLTPAKQISCVRGNLRAAHKRRPSAAALRSVYHASRYARHSLDTRNNKLLAGLNTAVAYRQWPPHSASGPGVIDYCVASRQWPPPIYQRRATTVCRL